MPAGKSFFGRRTMPQVHPGFEYARPDIRARYTFGPSRAPGIGEMINGIFNRGRRGPVPAEYWQGKKSLRDFAKFHTMTNFMDAEDKRNADFRHEHGQLQELLNSKPRSIVNPSLASEINEMRTVLIMGIESGALVNITNPAELKDKFKKYLLLRARSDVAPHDPNSAGYIFKHADRLSNLLINSFSVEQMRQLNMHSENFYKINHSLSPTAVRPVTRAKGAH